MNLSASSRLQMGSVKQWRYQSCTAEILSITLCFNLILSPPLMGGYWFPCTSIPRNHILNELLSGYPTTPIDPLCHTCGQCRGNEMSLIVKNTLVLLWVKLPTSSSCDFFSIWNGGHRFFNIVAWTRGHKNDSRMHIAERLRLLHCGMVATGDINVKYFSGNKRVIVA